MNALQALSLLVLVQDLMLKHLMLATIDPETQREWELNTAWRTDIPTTAELGTLMQSKCRALERIHINHSLKISPATSRSTHIMEEKSVNLHIPT